MKRERRVVITGLGIVSPLGSDVRTFWQGLSRGESGIRPITSFDTSGFKSSLAGEVQDFDATDFIPFKQARRMGRVSHFAVAAAHMAVRDAQLVLERENRGKVAVCFGTSVGGLREAFSAHDSVLKGQHVNPFMMTATFPNAVSSEVAIALGVHGQCETYSIGCSSTANAMGRAYDLIRSGQANLILAGGAEAPLHQTIFAAMEAGRTLAPDQQGLVRNLPRPFDQTRCGIVLAEGGGCVVLEEYDHAVSRGAPIYGEVQGWSFTCDAYSMARPLETGEEQRRAIEQALLGAKWFPEEVDYVSACGLGSLDLDAVETSALKQAIGTRAHQIPVTSFKGALGHAFAASGAFQVIGTLLAMEHQFVPPTLNLATPDPACDLDYVPLRGRILHGQRALINSFGFGGKNIVLALARVEGMGVRAVLSENMDWEAASNVSLSAMTAKPEIRREDQIRHVSTLPTP